MFFQTFGILIGIFVCQDGHFARSDSYCDGSSTNTSGSQFIRSPNTSLWLWTPFTCTWEFDSHRRGKILSLTFVEFAMEKTTLCTGNYIEVSGTYQVSRFSYPRQLGRYCGTNYPHTPLFAHEHMKIIYKHNRNAKNKFNLRLDIRDEKYSCGETTLGKGWSQSGSILSPNYPAQYPWNAQCIWNIEASENEVVTLRFHNMDLEASSLFFLCIHDYVTIYNQPGQIIGDYCGHSTPPDPVISIGSIRIKFASDRAFQFTGFNATYEKGTSPGCGQRRFRNGHSGTLSWPQPTVQSLMNASCLWIIDVPHTNGELVVINIASIDIKRSVHCRRDFLKIAEENNEVAGTFCGNTSNKELTLSAFRAKILLKIDSSESSSFLLTWRKEETNYSCGPALLTQPFGFLLSPNYPRNFPNQTSCSWTIIAPVGQAINLTILSGTLSEDNTLDIYDNDTKLYSEPQRVHLLSRADEDERSFQSRSISSVGNTMKIVFHGISHKFKKEGFRLRWKFQNESGCGEIRVSGSSGELTSPNYPGSHNTPGCTWRISVPVGRRLVLRSGGDKARCQKTTDFVEIFDGETKSLGRYCPQMVPDILLSSGNLMKIALRHLPEESSKRSSFLFSQERNNWFRVHWSTTALCGPNSLNNTHGQLTSPVRGDNQLEPMVCVWKVGAKSEEIVELTFVNMFRGAVYNGNQSTKYLDVYSGNLKRHKGKYSGKVDEPKILKVQPRQDLWLVYTSPAEQQQNQTTLAKWERLERYSSCTFASLKSSAGYLVSPGYPGNYKLPSSCSWNITAARGQNITISFTHFDVLCSEASLKIIGAKLEKNAKKRKLCGSSLPKPFTTNTSITIKFQAFRRTYFGYYTSSNAGSRSKHRGFELRYELNGDKTKSSRSTSTISRPTVWILPALLSAAMTAIYS